MKDTDRTDNDYYDSEYFKRLEIINRKKAERIARMKKRILRQKLCAAAITVCISAAAVIMFLPGNKKPENTVSDAAVRQNEQAPVSSSSAENSEEDRGVFISYDLGFTKEILNKDRLDELKTPDGSADREKCMEYVDCLAEKYDTVDKPRRFHATLQGDITVPPSNDAKYGWKIDREKTCEELVGMIEKGETAENIRPVYYDAGYGYVFTGMEEARTADDDIGTTYIEIDLSAQHLWFYSGGMLLYDCDIVSGQTTSMARTTLPGVYKVWYKALNYRMIGTNADGESWDSRCNYWISVSLCGIGLHDTVSRTEYGGDVYKYNGSQGCINMPLEGAKLIYEKAEMDTPVVMYYSPEESAGLGLDISEKQDQ